MNSVIVNLGYDNMPINRIMNERATRAAEIEYQNSVTKEVLDSFENGVARVIITSESPEELTKLRDKIKSGSNNKIQDDLPIVNGFSSDIDEKTVMEILPDIFKSNNHTCIFSDHETFFFDSATEVTAKPVDEASITENVSLDNMNILKFHEKGIKGKGETICFLDSGIAPHPDFEGRIKHFEDLTFFRSEPYDDMGHGTHCVGIAAGSGKSSNGKFVGVAPEAEIVSVKILAPNGIGDKSRTIKGLQWVLENKDKYGITVLNISVGGPPTQPYKDDPIAQAAAKVVKAGIHVFCSAGNRGNMDGALSTPGVCPDVSTVGALDDHNTLDRSDDTVAPYSSNGPTPFNKLPKPDFIYPGSNIKSTGLNNDYVVYSGTSMSTPGVSGVAALLNQITKHTVQPEKMKESLKETADKLPEYTEYYQGAGVIDAVEAAEKLTGKPFSEITA